MMDAAGRYALCRVRMTMAALALALAIGLPTPAAVVAQVSAQAAAPEIVVYVSELPRRALSEFRYWDDPASPGGRLVGYPNTRDYLDPPPENDPHLIFPVPVVAGVPYRCWIHMKVGEPGGPSTANLVWVQFTGAVDSAGGTVLAPRTDSYLTAQGPTAQGWAWVGCDSEQPGLDHLVRFEETGEATVRIQAGMEGVGLDQIVLSPARYLENPPSQAVAPKSN
jgi:hypothetical protein